MKLIYCKECRDIVRLRGELRWCECGASMGRYTGVWDAEIGGSAIPLGFDSLDFFIAIEERPERGLGKEFTAFVIPKKCSTVEVIDG